MTPDNPTRGLDAHQGGVLLHDGTTGELVALLNASPVTEIRTAAVSAVATRALARADAERVAILGAGVQARAHVHAMRAVLDDPEIRIWARSLDAAEALAAEVGAVVAPSPDAALFGAEIVCTTTSATRADRRASLARLGRTRQRRRLEHPDHARARHRDRGGELALRRPPRVDAERGGRLPDPARRKGRSGRITSRPSSARCSSERTPGGRARTS